MASPDLPPNRSTPPLPPSPLTANGKLSSPHIPGDILTVWHVHAPSCIRNTLATAVVLAVALYAADYLLGPFLPSPAATCASPGAVRPGLMPAPLGILASAMFACASPFVINLLAPTMKGFRVRLGEATTWPGGQRELVHIDPGSALKVGVASGALLGAVAACLTWVMFWSALGLPMGWQSAGASPQVAGVIAFVSLVALYAVSAGVSAVVGAVVYNQLALRWGGVWFQTAQDGADETAHLPAHDPVGRGVQLKSVTPWQAGVAGALACFLLGPLLGAGAVLTDVLTSSTSAWAWDLIALSVAGCVAYCPVVGCLVAWASATLYNLAAGITGGLEVRVT